MADRVDVYAGRCSTSPRPKVHVDEVEDELFRFARTFEGNDDLRIALADPRLPVERRLAVVEELLGGKALAASTRADRA